MLSFKFLTQWYIMYIDGIFCRCFPVLLYDNAIEYV